MNFINTTFIKETHWKHELGWALIFLSWIVSFFMIAVVSITSKQAGFSMPSINVLDLAFGLLLTWFAFFILILLWLPAFVWLFAIKSDWQKKNFKKSKDASSFPPKKEKGLAEVRTGVN